MSTRIDQRSEVIDGATVTLFENNSISNEKKTFIIFGNARGGTTMVAGVAKLCGLDIGQNLPINLEDDDFNPHMLRKRGIDQPVPHVITVLEQRNKMKNIWGWKFPRAIAYLDQVRQHIINPHLILVYRDPIATATRVIQSGSPKFDAINSILNLQLRNLELVKNWQVPSLLVSYERSISFPEQFIANLCNFLNVERPADISSIRSFMQPGEYKSI